MGEDLLDIVEREINNDVSPDQIKDKLIQKGFLENDIENAINTLSSKHSNSKLSHDKILVRLFSTKEVFDRIGYGFVPHQFINILFYLTGAGYLWLGLLNGARAIISIVLSSILQERRKFKEISKKTISIAGYLYGFSFFGMAFATLAKSVPLFAFFLLLGSVGIATHGDLYNHFVKKHLKKERMSKFLAKIANYGILITAVCILISGWIMDLFPVLGSETISLFGKTYPLYGYLISFEVTAIAFILSGHFLAHVKELPGKQTVEHFAGKYFKDIKVYLGTFLKNKNLFFLILTTIIVGFVQVLGNSYYGVFIYHNFKNIGLGGFMNVAVIYTIAILFSFIGPWFSRKMEKKTGLAPTLVFGTLLIALMPFTLAYNPNLLAIGAANALSVVGAAILGVSQGLLAHRLLREDERKVYFSVVSMAAVIPFLILIPLGAYYAQMQGLTSLFNVLGILLAAIVAPLYIILVLMGSKNKL